MHLLQTVPLLDPARHLRAAPHPPARWWPRQERLSKLCLPLLVEQRPLPRARVLVAAVAHSIHPPLVVAAGYLAHPSNAVAGDLRDLLGLLPLAKQPHDLVVRALDRVLRLSVAVFQLLRGRMRRQLYPLWHTFIVQPDSV